MSEVKETKNSCAKIIIIVLITQIFFRLYFYKSTHSGLSFAASPLCPQGSYNPTFISHFGHGHIPQDRQYVGHSLFYRH